MSKYQLTSADIIKLIKNDTSGLQSVSGCTVGNGKYEFSGDVEIVSLDLSEIEDFNGNIFFNQVTFLGDVKLTNLKELSSYKFSNCHFKGEVLLDGYGVNIFLEETTWFRSNARIQFGKTDTEAFKLENIEFEKQLILKFDNRNVSVKNLNIIEEKKRGHLIILGLIADFTLSTCYTDTILLGNKKDQEPHELIFGGEINLTSIVSKEIIINEATIENVFSLKGCTIDNAVISNLRESSNVVEIKDGCNIGNCRIHFGTLNSIKISNSNLNKLEFFDDLKQPQTIYIEDCTVTNLQFNKVENRGLIYLDGMTIPENGTLSMIRSHLGQTNFIDCNIKKATFEFQNSKLNSIFAVNTKFPRNISLNNKPNPKQARLVFSQLHQAYERHGDTVNQSRYQSAEISAYFDLIRASPLKKDFWKKDFWTRINLWLNKWSNNFGASWERGVLFTLFWAALAFFAMVYFTDEGFSAPNTSAKDYISAFLKFLNPIRLVELDLLFTNSTKTVDSINSDRDKFLTLRSLSYIIDFLGRIIIAYGIYQTVQAFRRFGKK